MALLRFKLRRSMLFVSGFLLSAAAQWAQPVRIAQVDDTATVQWPGKVSPKAQVQYAEGPVEPSFPMRYVVLLLQRSTRQKASLAHLLADQQDRSSAKIINA